MATNLKGQGGIKGLFLLHGEKIAIALVSVVALLFVFKAYKIPRLADDFQAPKLQSKISETSTLIKDFSWTKAVSEFPDKVKKAEPIAAKSDLTVKYENYESPPKFDVPVVASMTMRTDPLMLNAVDVQANGGSGLLAFTDEKIRRELELRKATELAEENKKAADQQRKDELRQQREGGRNNRGPDGRRDVAALIADPAHPKRRPVEGSARALGVPLQGGERIERAYWACVVAKVPIRQQFNLYEDAFKNARGYDQARDFPHYYGYMVERAEVLPGKPLEWKRVPLYDGQRQSVVANKPIDQTVNVFNSVPKLYDLATQFWAGMAPDVIDGRFADQVLTLPLPPLVGRTWGSEATHPDIPLLANTPPLEPEEQQQPAEQAPTEPAATDENAGFAGPTGVQPNMPTVPGANMRRPSFGGPEAGMARMYGGPEGGDRMGMGRGRMGPEGGLGQAVGSFSRPGDRTTLTKGVDFLLLRFFDYSVESGKKYKYRVKLVLADPNAGLLPNVLAPAVLDRQAKLPKDKTTGQRVAYRFVSDWSEPSPTVGIPMAGNVRLADYKIPPPEKYNDEPSATLFVEAFDADEKGNAIQTAVEKKDCRRGYVANFLEDAEYLVEGGVYIDTQPGFKFLTGMTMLDIDGGNKLSKDMNAPVRMLIMGPSGQLYVRNELDDKPVVEYHKLLFAKTNEKRRGSEGREPVGPEGGGPRGRRP